MDTIQEMATVKIPNYCYEHSYFWKKHKDHVLHKFLHSSDDPEKLVLNVERVDKDQLNRDWEHRCKDCNACANQGATWCKRCARLHFSHNLETIYFLVGYFNKCYYRLIFYVKK